MSQALTLTVTTAGRAALVNAKHDGTNAVLVASVGVTAATFTPDPLLTKLPGEAKRLTTLSGGATAADTVHVTIRDTSTDTYTVRGIGLYLQDGTLFGVYGQAGVLAEKSTQATLLLAVDTRFADINAASLVFGDTNFQLNKATTTIPGVVQLAAASDVIAGADAALAVTPATFKAGLDDRLGTSAPTKFAKALLAAVDAIAFRAGLGLKSAALRDTGANNGLDADLLDGQEGAFYQAWANLTGVPAAFPPMPHQHAIADIVGLAAALATKLDGTSRYYPGQIIVTAATTPPPYTLLCDGAAISRTQYAALFAAIGTTYGAGDGTNTFNVPNLREGTAIRVTVKAAKVGTYDAGAILSHTHTASATAVGDHAHSVTLTNAGSHTHAASSDARGDHVHSAWTDGQGNHAHSGSTDAQGQHSHVTLNNVFGDGTGSSYVGGGGPAFRSMQRQTNDAGNHAHNFSTDWQGNHGHNIGMNGSGNHSHTISVAAVGDHNHTASVGGAGGHTHTLTVAAAGGTDNLPAGTYMLHCIAY
jgi:microcystin-dependent protein